MKTFTVSRRLSGTQSTQDLPDLQRITKFLNGSKNHGHLESTKPQWLVSFAAIYYFQYILISAEKRQDIQILAVGSGDHDRGKMNLVTYYHPVQYTYMITCKLASIMVIYPRCFMSPNLTSFGTCLSYIYQGY